jgi:alkylation response protein AidB-like acyl-CoA dehydrogenase
MDTTTVLQKGGAWLIEDAAASAVFTPERMSDEQRMIGRTTEEFVSSEVLPNLARLEEKDWTLARRLLRECADLGLVGIDVSERFGGVGLDKVTSIVVGERVAGSASFAASYGAQTGLTIMPILCFGTADQQERYLPKLVTAELVGAYALSESGSGSDALGARARATRQPDGSFVLNGEKMWITNGGFADIFIVFAKVDGEAFTAFIVERGFGGVTSGKEEHKMGLLGSSTTPLILQDARVPATNLLGEIGKGHKVAFNILNYGRLKLGAMCSGGAKRVLGEAARYAAERRQFGQPIASFGAIRHKLGEMTARLFALESALYRTAGSITAMLDGHDADDGEAVLAALEEFAVESSVAKVAGSETLDFVLDENVQIHGGNGFVRDYAAERHYRDGRVNRIFEGTNEINRLLIPDMLIRRALKGDLGLIPAAKKLQDELLSTSATAARGTLDDERNAIRGCKKLALMVIGTAMQRFGQKLRDEQEILTCCADIVIDTYLSESAVLRAAASAGTGDAGAALQETAARIFTNDAAGRVETAARQALAAMAEGDMLRTQLAAARRFLKVLPINTVAGRRRLADAVVERKGYPFAV